MKTTILNFLATAMIVAVCALAGCQTEGNMLSDETEISTISDEEIVNNMMEALAALPEHHNVKMLRVLSDGNVQAASFNVVTTSWLNDNETVTRSSGGSWIYYGEACSQGLEEIAVSHIKSKYPNATPEIRIVGKCARPACSRANMCHYCKVAGYWCSVIEHRLGSGMPGNAHCPATSLPDCSPHSPYTVYFPHPNACSYFFLCNDGVPICAECPSDLHWNKELETCDYQWDAGCSTPEIDPPTNNCEAIFQAEHWVIINERISSIARCPNPSTNPAGYQSCIDTANATYNSKFDALQAKRSNCWSTGVW
jgi:hypothetical protein